MTDVNPTLDLRLVAYSPDGSRLGELPQPTTFTHSRVTNDVPSLTFDYSTTALRSSWLENDVEIVVQWNDGEGWKEDTDSRFLLISSDRDDVDATGTVSYTCPGYAWLLNKCKTPTDPANSPDNNGITYTGKTIGYILHDLITSAKGRDQIPQLAMSFSATTDTAGAEWDAVVTLAVARGTSILTVLQQFSQSGQIDWNMQGRTLNVHNGQNELAIPRTAPQRVTDTTSINPTSFFSGMTTVDGSVTAKPGNGTSTDRSQMYSNVGHMMENGVPLFLNNLNMEYLTGQWSTHAGRDISTMRNLGADAGGVTRAFGYWVADVESPIRYVLVVADPSDADAIAIGLKALDNTTGGAMVVADTEDNTYEWWHDTLSGVYWGLQEFSDRKIPIIHIASRSDDYILSGTDHIYVLVQTGATAYSAWHSRIAGNLGGMGFGRVSTDINDGLAFGSGTRSTTDRAMLYVTSQHAHTKTAPWVRLSIWNTFSSTTTGQNDIRDAIDYAVTNTAKNAFPRITAKPSTDVNVVRVTSGAVDLRYGVDILAAPVQRTIENRCERVYVYGDGFASVTLENGDTINSSPSWGVWEEVIGQGGILDDGTMQALGYDALNKGAYISTEVQRDLTFQTGRYLPYRDYDHGDHILTQIADGTLEAHRIQQMMVTKNEDGSLKGTLVMDTAFESSQQKTNRAIRSATGATGGSKTSGASAVMPALPAKNPLKPATPTGLS